MSKRDSEHPQHDQQKPVPDLRARLRLHARRDARGGSGKAGFGRVGMRVLHSEENGAHLRRVPRAPRIRIPRLRVPRRLTRTLAWSMSRYVGSVGAQPTMAGAGARRSTTQAGTQTGCNLVSCSPYLRGQREWSVETWCLSPTLSQGRFHDHHRRAKFVWTKRGVLKFFFVTQYVS